jgi:riboflavin synthase
MFTGIVTDIGKVLAVKPHGTDLHRVKIACRYPRASIDDGASISCAGVCLTVVGSGEEDGRTWFAVDAAAETLRVTTTGGWQHGTRINLERSLRVGDELGGHFVLGHVDGITEIAKREDMTESARFVLRAPQGLMPFIAAHTLQVTTFGALKAGDRLNLEVDVMARYAARLLETR